MGKHSQYDPQRYIKDGKYKPLYVQLSPATTRYQRLMELSHLYQCSYHRIVLDAIDWYLNTKVPRKT